MPVPLISVLHPTRRVGPSEAFPQGWRDAFEAWVARADKPQRIEYVIAVHESRWAEFWKHSGFVYWEPDSIDLNLVRIPAGYRAGLHSLLVVRNTGRDCAVEQINCAARASSGLLLTGAHDDLYPPEHWDSVSSFAGSRSEIVIRCSSGSDRDATLTMAGFTSRNRCERKGYVLHPDFRGMFADDFFDFEMRLDQEKGVCSVVERPDIVFEHRHPFFGKGQMDAAYAAHNDPLEYFLGHNTLMKLTGRPTMKAIAVCLPGENFRSEWVYRWTALYGHLAQGRGLMTLPFFAYTSNVYCTRIELAKAVLDNPIPVDYVLSIDDDNTLTPEHFDMLLNDLESHPELDGVVGWCWCDNHQTKADEARTWVMSVGRQGPNMECSRFGLEDFRSAADGYLLGSDQIPEPDGFWSGLPVALFRRKVFEVLGSGCFAPVFKPEVNFGFTGEDTAFFWRARQAGLKFACDFRVKVPHVKWRVIEPMFAEGNKPVAVPEMESSAAD